jgi:hypothetical protein
MLCPVQHFITSTIKYKEGSRDTHLRVIIGDPFGSDTKSINIPLNGHKLVIFLVEFRSLLMKRTGV